MVEIAPVEEFDCPAVIVDSVPMAWLLAPPRIASAEVEHGPVGTVPGPARLSHPPVTLAHLSVARLNCPPVTDAAAPDAWLACPATRLPSPAAMLDCPNAAAYPPVARLLAPPTNSPNPVQPLLVPTMR